MDLNDLDVIFRPKTMVVIGVSTKRPLFPGTIIYNKNLHEYPVDVYPMNATGGVIEGNKVYKKITEIPVDLDLAVLVVKAKYVPEALIECGEAGVKSAIIVSGGFAEMGENGKRLENQSVEIAYKYNLPFMGPNCIGIHSNYVDTFILPSERLATPPSGNVAVVSQSGGVLIDQILSKFHEREIGISAAASIGNKALITEVNLLNYFNKNPEIDTIVFYNEGFKENTGMEFFQLARTMHANLVVLRGGKSKYGARAALSHTAAIATNAHLISASFQQAGIIEAITETELVTYTKVLSFGLPGIVKGNIAILSISGGHAVLSADLCAYYKLRLITFTKRQQDRLKEGVNPSAATIATFDNPIDLTGSVTDTDIEYTLETLLSFDSVEGIVILLVPYVPTISMQIGRRLSNIVRNSPHKKPVIAYLPWLNRYGIIIRGLELNKTIPVAHTVEESIQMMHCLHLKGLKDEKFKLTKNPISELRKGNTT
ncbi:MAG: CoA-binding protein [Candidatus Helarchaeota archaeon]